MNKQLIKKSGTYFDRLNKMSFSEIIESFNNFIYLFYEKTIKSKKKISPYCLNTGRFLLVPKDILLIRKYYEQNINLKETLINNADNILGNRFSFFMLNNLYFGENINWHKDYPNNKICESTFYSNIDYKNYEKNGDVKYIWEQNRCLHLYKLSQALLITSNAKYARGITTQIESWIDNNPYLMGINWASSLEIAIRLISWSWAYQSLKLINYKINANFEKKFLTSIYQQLDYISNHISKYSSANNHVIGEAAGLIIAGCTFDFGSDSTKWIQKGMKLLEKEVPQQLSTEGLSKEQSISYHMFVFDFLLMAYLIGSKNGQKFSNMFIKSFKKMAKVLISISDNEFKLPNIGDADEGMVVKLSNQNDFNPLLSLFNISSFIFNDGHFKFAPRFDEKALWLSGHDGLASFTSMTKQSKTIKSEYLKDSGYYVFKTPDIYALLDVGNLGYLSSAIHGHADALSFLLTYKGKEILIDAGTFTYNFKSPWRKYFRGTFAHNTLCVDKISQSVISEDLSWDIKANVNVAKTQNSQAVDYIIAEHDGYKQQKIGVEHTREVLFQKDNFFVVVDRAKNTDNKKHCIDLNWHFSNECDVNNFDGGFAVTNQDSNVYFSILSDTQFNTTLYKGSERPRAGWISKKYDFRQMSATLNSSIETSKTVFTATLITFDEMPTNINLQDNKLKFDYKGVSEVLDLNQLAEIL